MDKGTCSIADCDKPVRSFGWCSKHYTRWRTHGDPLWEPRQPIKVCSFPGCGKPHSAHGYCDRHGRLFREGAELVPLRVQVKGRGCSVEGCDEPHSGRGYCAVHYQHWYRYGDPLAGRPERQLVCSFPDCGRPFDSRGLCTGHAWQSRQGMELRPIRGQNPGATCSIAECAGPVVARGWCSKHWNRWRSHGSPLIKLPPHREGARKWALNEHYFDEITDEHRAYWLGFIAADGGIVRQVNKTSGGRSSWLRIELNQRDVDHLRKFNADIESEAPLKPRRNCVVASVNSWRMADALERLGITERKSATVKPWDGPAGLMPHYWRGLVDGDGGIYRSRSGWAMSLCGSSACVEAFAQWARAVTGSRAKAHLVKGECWAWTVGGSRMCQVLARALYANADIALTRKQVRADELLGIDFVARAAARNRRRSLTMQNAWATGRHSRSSRDSQAPTLW